MLSSYVTVVETFPTRSKGWKVVGAEDVFVYHRGKVSFRNFKAETFTDHNYPLFMERWGEDYRRAMARYNRADALGQLRDSYVRMGEPVPSPVLSALVERVKMGGPVYATTEARRYIRGRRCPGGRRHGAGIRSIRDRSHRQPRCGPHRERGRPSPMQLSPFQTRRALGVETERRVRIGLSEQIRQGHRAQAARGLAARRRQGELHLGAQ